VVRHFLRETYYTTREFSENAKLFLLSTFLTWTGVAIQQVLFNLYLKEGAFTEEFVGRCVSMTGLGMALAALPAGWLSDRIGRRLCLLLGSAGLGAAHLARCLTLDPDLLMVATFAGGACNALVAISASPFLSENSEAHVRTHLFSAHFVVALAAGIVGSLLGGQIPQWAQDYVPAFAGSPLLAYRWTLAIGALTIAFSGWPLLAVREVPPVADNGNAEAPPPSSRTAMAKLALNYFLIGSGAGLVIPFFNLYFAQRFGATSAQIGVYFSGSQVITALAALGAPVLARRVGLLQTVTVLQLASLPFLVTLGLETTLAVSVVAFWVRACLMQAASPLLNAFAMEAVAPPLRARTAALTNTVWHLGWAASASLAGWIIARYGYEYPYYLTAALYGTATVLFYRMFKDEGHRIDARAALSSRRVA
jgi:MFS family permease